MTDIKDAPENMLRAWADCGVISSARYVEEIERRAGRTKVGAPPLDYALDDELAIPDLDSIEAMFDDGVPVDLSPAARCLLTIAAVSAVAIALWLVWP